MLGQHGSDGKSSRDSYGFNRFMVGLGVVFEKLKVLLGIAFERSWAVSG